MPYVTIQGTSSKHGVMDVIFLMTLSSKSLMPILVICQVLTIIIATRGKSGFARKLLMQRNQYRGVWAQTFALPYHDLESYPPCKAIAIF